MSDEGDDGTGFRNLRFTGGPASGGEAWGTMIIALRGFLDTVAAAHPDAVTIAALGEDLSAWTRRLAPSVVAERRQIFGRRPDLPDRGQSMLPPVADLVEDESGLRATVTFGRYFLGVNGAAHGGAIALMFDDLLGRVANIGRSVARTAYLKTDFRAIAPVDERLDLHV